MSQENILDYLRQTPHNTNVNVVKGMIGNTGSSLPEVNADDNGKVLTVVQGQWDKADGGGGSGFTIKFTTSDNGNTYTADKSYEETLAACESFTPINAYIVSENNSNSIQYTGYRKPMIIAEDNIIPGGIWFASISVGISDSYMEATSVALMSDDSVVVTLGEFSLTAY